MTTPHTDWRASAAYIYILHLDSTSLAWEYLRRNRAYRRDWSRFVRQYPGRLARKWGMQFRRGS
jgi:Family of unknown function (DUF6499)